MSDAQLLSYFNRIEKILNETKIYTKLMSINKEGLAPNYYDEDELLFPLEIGHEMYNKTLKVYLESKAYIDSIEKTLNKCIDKIGKNDKASHLINQNKINNASSNSSSSSDEEKSDQVGQKRKPKTKGPGSKMNKRPKQPPPQQDEVNSTVPHINSTTTSSTSTNIKDKEKEKEKEREKFDKLEKESSSVNGVHNSKDSKSSTPNKESHSNNNNNANNNIINNNSSLNNSNNNNNTNNNNNNNNSSNNNSNNSNNNSNGNGNSSNGNNNNNSNGNHNSSGNGFHGMQPGQLVAARDSKSNQWILAKVSSFSQKTQKYEVIDEDEEESKRFSVGQKDIIQLPSHTNLPPTFSNNTKVLAMFPDTTAFYPAVVVNVQKVKGKPTFYHLHFEDDQENGETPNRRVNAQHVVALNNGGEFSKQTIGLDFKVKSVNIGNDKIVKFQIWDSTNKYGNELQSYYFKKTNGYLLLMDVTNQSSFLNLPFWINQINEMHKKYASNSDDEIPKIVIIANKSDEIEKIVIDKKTAQNYCDSLSIPLFYVSAKSNENIDEAFKLLQNLILKSEIPHELPPQQFPLTSNFCNIL
ncbi:hypothetical protein ACTFIT_002353 [Dictyostelium discoideum]